MSTPEFQKCENVDPAQGSIESKPSSVCGEQVATTVAPVASITRRRRIEVAILIVTLILLAFQGMTFSLVKRVDESLQEIIQANGFGSSTERNSDENQQSRFTLGRRSLSIAH